MKHGFRKKLLWGIASLMLIFALNACSSSGGGDDTADSSAPSTEGTVTDAGADLARFSSGDELERYLKSGLRASSSEEAYMRNEAPEFLAAGGADDASGTSVGQTFSATNLQEQGVDEADIVKTDGQYLYIAPGSEPVFYAMGGMDDVAEPIAEDDEGTRRRRKDDPVETEITREEDPAPITVSVTSTDITGQEEPLVIAPAPFEEETEEPIEEPIDTPIDEPKPEIEPLIAPNPYGEPANPVIRIMSLSDAPAAAAEVTTIDVSDFENKVDGLYLVTDREDGNPDLLVVMAGQSQDMWGCWFSPWYWNNGKTEVGIYNVDNPASPSQISRISFDGQLISSRRIGEMLYLVSRYTPNLPEYRPYPVDEDQIAENEAVLENAELDDLLPSVTVNGEERGGLIAPTDCYLPPAGEEIEAEPTLITVTAIRLSNPDDRISRTITGPTETIYVSPESLYLATTQYYYPPMMTLAEDGTVSDTESTIPPETTDLHKFALTADGPVYKGSGHVVGNLGWDLDKKPFRMSEYEETLRIATSLGDTWNETSTTRLTLLREDGNGNLAETGFVDNIGETGESLYAVRYVGARGYLVTFRVTDPLYVFDLSDPYNPVKAGELHISGYSDYLHPVSETLLLGIGKDAVPDNGSSDFGGRGAWYQGVKISLFDVSNPASPTELDSLIIGKRGTESDALHDHHALAWLPGENGRPDRLALPIRLHNTPYDYSYGQDPSDPSYWYDWTHTGLYLFEIGPNMIDNTDQMIIADRTTQDYDQWSPVTDRAVILGESVHYVHNAQVWSAPWENAANDMTEAQ